MARKKVDSAHINILAELREDAELTQKDVANYFGLGARQGRQSIIRWESGKVVPHRKQRPKFIDYFLFLLGFQKKTFEEFQSLWNVLVTEWEWEPLSSSEIEYVKQKNQYSLIVPNASESELPPITPNFYGRNTEISLYRQVLDEQNYLIIAGAPGIGKTWMASKLCSFTKTNRVFWMTCYLNDGISTIVRRLAAWLSYYHNDHTFWRLLHAEVQPPYELLDNLLERSQQIYPVLCFDNFHLLEGSKALVSKLIFASQSNHIKIIMCVQNIFDIPWQLKTHTLEGLTREDTSRILAANGIRHDDLFLQSIHTVLDGNAQLIDLAIALLQDEIGIELFVGKLLHADQVEEFLLQNVDDNVDEDERMVLSAISVLLGYPATASAIEAALDGTNVRPTLTKLSRRHLLQITQYESSREYALHRIMQEYYYHETLGDQQRCSMHYRVARFFETVDDDFRAGLHYAYANDYLKAAQYAYSDVRSRLIQGHGSHLRAMLERINSSDLSMEIQARLSLAHGQVSIFFQRPLVAQKRLEEAFTLFSQLNQSSIEHESKFAYDLAQTCRELGYLLKLSKPADATSWLLRGLDITREDPEQMADLYIQLAEAYSRLGNNQAVITSLERVLEILPDTPSWFHLLALMGMGKHHYYQNNLSESESYWRSALDMSENIHDPFNTLILCTNLAALNQSLGNWKPAMEYYQRANNLAVEYGYIREKARIDLNSGVLYLHKGNRDTALKLLEHVRGVAQTRLIVEDLIISLGYLSELAIIEGDLKQADILLSEAEERLEQTSHRFLEPFITYVRAQYWLESDVPEEAEAKSIHAVKVAKELGMSKEEGLARRVQIQVLLGRNEHSQAEQEYQQCKMLLSENSYERAKIDLIWGRHLIDVGQLERGRSLRSGAALTLQKLGVMQNAEK